MNNWDKWRAALADPRKIGSDNLTIHPGQPWCGFFRVRRKGGDWEPVQFWQDEESGVWCATRAGQAVDPDRIEDLFLWAVKNPISEEAFDRALAGNGWEDEPERPAGIGHNSGDSDPFEALRTEYLGEKELVEPFLKKPIASKEDADRAAIWAKRLRDIANRADKLHAEEKAPLLVATRKVDSKWRELREGPAGFSTLLKRHQDEWLREQERLEKERVRAAAVEAERLRHEAAEAAAKADTPEAQAEAGAKLAAAKEAARQAEFQRPQAGRTGAKTSLRTYRTGLITDFDAFLAAVKDQEEIRTAAERVCNRLARQERPVAGMEIVEDRRAV
jgi:hypothetical protein